MSYTIAFTMEAVNAAGKCACVGTPGTWCANSPNDGYCSRGSGKFREMYDSMIRTKCRQRSDWQCTCEQRGVNSEVYMSNAGPSNSFLQSTAVPENAQPSDWDSH